VVNQHFIFRFYYFYLYSGSSLKQQMVDNVSALWHILTQSPYFSNLVTIRVSVWYFFFRDPQT